MPTPLMHLYLAEQLREQLEHNPTAPAMALALTLRQSWAAFCLGNVAPDYQVLGAVPREETHFYPLPPQPEIDAGAAMLRRYPELRATRCQSRDQAVFVAGYLSHLLVDLAWFRDILQPYFVEPEGLGDVEERILLHNLTLMVLDQRLSRRLPAGLDKVLQSSNPTQWLPFAADEDLIAWRDYLVGQLVEDGAIQTVEIYAQRMSIAAAELHENLNDVEWLEHNLLARVPLAAIEAKLMSTIQVSQTVIQEYLGE